MLNLIDLHMENTQPIPEESAAPANPRRLPVRLVAAVVFFGSLGLLVTSALLSPSSAGTGTHQQLGLPSCGLLESTGIPCATCGMTTAFAYAADGRLIQSFITQPAGALLAIIVATMVIGSGFTLVTGAGMSQMFLPFLRPKPLIVFGIFFAMSWMYKVATVMGFIPSL